jgi:nucleoside phosphorylase
MIADRAWMKRNMGFDPYTTPPPAATFATTAAAKSSATPEDYEREIIDFDSESPAGKEFTSFSTATGLSSFIDIPWPSAMAPKTASSPGKGPGGALPNADVLVVTWTVDEGHATSRVLTPGKDSRNDYAPYTHNFSTLKADFRAGCPAIEANRLGAYWKTRIAGKSVIVFKSDSHLSQDGPKAPNIKVWAQIIDEVKPKLILTTGTGGGIGSNAMVGDVIVSPVVHFDAIKKFKTLFGAQPPYVSATPNQKYFATAERLFKTNADRLPTDNKRLPKISTAPLKGITKSVVTTDFFGFDTTANTYQLRGLGSLSEMGDAVLGYVTKSMTSPPPWLAVRNVSDPQIKSEGTIKQQANAAAQIYKAFGRWSTVCSAITCCSLIAAL